jgi:hypothetical protein
VQSLPSSSEVIPPADYDGVRRFPPTPDLSDVRRGTRVSAELEEPHSIKRYAILGTVGVAR